MEESGKELGTLLSDELKVIEEAATLSAKEAGQGEYGACLCLLLTDNEKYGTLKTQLDNTLLIGEQDYSSDVLVAKWLMMDFVPGTGEVKHKRQESNPSDVAFVETKDKRMWYLTCYCCGEKHPGGYKNKGGARTNDQGGQRRAFQLTTEAG